MTAGVYQEQWWKGSRQKMAAPSLHWDRSKIEVLALDAQESHPIALRQAQK